MSRTKLPEWFEKDYENWKKNLWGAFRAFFSGFITSLSVSLIGLTGELLGSTEWWLDTALRGAILAGLIYLGKWLRDTFSESSSMQRIPI